MATEATQERPERKKKYMVPQSTIDTDSHRPIHPITAMSPRFALRIFLSQTRMIDNGATDVELT